MLSAPKTASPNESPPRPAEKRVDERDPAAEFIHDLAESGTANELSTVKAASDAVEGEAKETEGEQRRRKQGE